MVDRNETETGRGGDGGDAAIGEGVLTGVRVLELANFVAAPSCGSMMADLGADVIKLEPPGGDPYRHYMQRSEEYGYPFKANMAFHVDNRGKRSIVADLTHPEALPFVLEAVRHVDIFTTNLLPKRRAKFGLSHEALRGANPRLIDVALSGYGADGPDADKPGFDQSAYWARSGIMSMLGEPGFPPSSQRGAMGDHTAALSLLSGILAAMRLRDQSGEGQQVEVSLLATGMWVLGADIVSALADPQQPPSHDRTAPANALWNSYLTGDGKWVLLVMPQSDPYWQPLCRAMKKPDWAADARYASHELRVPHTPALTAELDTILAQRSLAEWGEIFDKEGLIWAPVSSVSEVVGDPQAEINNRFPTLEHPEIGSFRTVNAPFQLSDGAPGPRRPAPDVGAHTDEVLRDLDFAPEEIERLKKAGVVGG